MGNTTANHKRTTKRHHPHGVVLGIIDITTRLSKYSKSNHHQQPPNGSESKEWEDSLHERSQNLLNGQKVINNIHTVQVIPQG